MSSTEEPSLWRLLSAGVAVDDLRTNVINKLTGGTGTGGSSAAAAVIHRHFEPCQHKLNADFTVTGWDRQASLLQINGKQPLSWGSDAVGLALGIASQGSNPAEAYSNDSKVLVESDRALRLAFLRDLSQHGEFRDYVRGRYVELGIYSEERGLAVEAVHCFNEELKRKRRFNWIGQRVDVVHRFLSGGRSSGLDGADRQLLSEYVRCGMTLILAVKICVADAEGKLEQCRQERTKAVKDNSNLWSIQYTRMHSELESTIARVDAVEAEVAALREELKREVDAVRASVKAVQAGVAGVTEGLEACQRSVGGCLEEGRRGVEESARKRAEDVARWEGEFARINGQTGIETKNVSLLAQSVSQNLGNFRKDLKELESILLQPPPQQQYEELVEAAVKRQVRQYLDGANLSELLATKDAQLARARERIQELEANSKRRRIIDLSDHP